MAPGATHRKRASRKLCNTLLCHIKKEQIVEIVLLPSKNAQKLSQKIQTFKKNLVLHAARLGLC